MEKVSNFLFERISIPDLEKSLDAYSARHRAITNNIANVNTPGYKAESVSFEEEYKRQLKKGELPTTKTHNNHLPTGSLPLENLHHRHELREDRANDSGINNVDIDHEMAELAKNNLRYEMNTILISKRIKLLKSSIKGR